MALRNASRLFFKNWLGLNTFQNPENLTSPWWTDANNVTVSATGTAECLRSPATLNPALATGNKLKSLVAYTRAAGHRLVFDINLTSGSNVATYVTDGTTNTQVRTGQADAPWTSLNIDDKLYRINGSEFVQLQNDLASFYRNGIDAPASAPSISYVAGGSGSILSGVTVSYAYRNSVTKHVSRPSPISNTLGASGGNSTLRIPTTASGQAGVDGIVFFITVDGGSIPYLLIDTNGDPQVFSNTTGNKDISIATIFRDTLTPEPVYNFVPPTDATSMFRWKDRIFLVRGRSLQYSGFESTYIGQPWESWPTLNIINLPNRGDVAVGGIETEIGALVLGQQDSYLLGGYPSDKTSGPEAGIAVSEHLVPLGWHIGTKSPKTIKNTPFGTFWFDQNKRIQMWTADGFPREAALPIRDLLSQVLDANLGMAEAEWFQNGKNGGYYVLTASTSGTTNNRLYFITVYRDPESNELRFGFGTSDIAAQCLATSIITSERFFFGGTDRVFELLDPDKQGAGWSGQLRYFELYLGNDDNFAYYHSMRIDGDIAGLTLKIKNPDGTDEQTIALEQDYDTGGSWFGLLDVYGRRKVLRFEFDNTDTTLRQVKNLQVFTGNKPRNF